MFRVAAGRRVGRFLSWCEWRAPWRATSPWVTCFACGGHGYFLDLSGPATVAVYCGTCVGVGEVIPASAWEG